MQAANHSYLSCTNIHPGEQWAQVMHSLTAHALPVKQLMQAEPFGLGLRLSAIAATQLAQPDNLARFKDWLQANGMYVFTMNGFPYGQFHNTTIKDQVHAPDWTTPERLAYTKQLFDLLKHFLPEGEKQAGISTSPLSYKYWHTSPQAIEAVFNQATENMVQLVNHLVTIKNTEGYVLHVAIEPEPDGLIETSAELIHWYNNYLLKKGIPLLCQLSGCTPAKAEAHLRAHVTLCYDVCHFAVGFESQAQVMHNMQREGIAIGKVQISAALKARLTDGNRQEVARALAPFNEPSYLHQAVIQQADGSLDRYRDLPQALAALPTTKGTELRTHFHVPLFIEQYGLLASTQADVIEVLHLCCEQQHTRQLEVETYTWGLLPETLQLPINQSIARELQWVQQTLAQYKPKA